MFKRKDKPKIQEKVIKKVIDIESGLEGNIKFSSPINLRISGKFEGKLITKGTLTIGEKAEVKVRLIKGENIIILGKVNGNIISSNRLELSPPAKVIGNIEAPILVINEGAMLKGHCQVPVEEKKSELKKGSKKKRR